MALVPDDHDPQQDGHYIEIRLDFEPPLDGGPPTLAQVQTHVHHIPESLYIDALLVLAREQMKRQMTENMFKDSVPDQVREFAANLMASKYLSARLESGELGSTEAINMTVPDDARELFEDES